MMIDCCQGSGSVRSQKYNGLGSMVANLPSYLQPSSSQQQQQQQRPNSPQLNVLLDLPGYAGYQPIYWPGQKITGEVKIHLDSPIIVTHLRVALFGNVQVYGKHPGDPIMNGLFDYKKKEQLINTGLRIIRKSPPTSVQNDVPVTQPCSTGFSNGDSNVYLETDQQQQNRTDCRPYCTERYNTEGRQQQQDEVTTYHSTPHQQELSNVPSPNNRTNIKPKKTADDRYMEKLIRRIADIDHTTNVSNGILQLDKHASSINSRNNISRSEEPSSNMDNTFELSANAHQIRFSIGVPISHRLSGSFDHPHFPISYRVICIMKYKNQIEEDDREMACYSTVRLRLEPYIDVHSLSFSNPIQTTSKVLYVQRDNGLMTGMYTYILSSSSTLTKWIHQLTQQRKQKQVSPCYNSSYLEAHLELPKQAFERSQHIPLKLMLKNHASTHFKVSAVKMTFELTRRISMTCSISEEVEVVVVPFPMVLFKSTEEEEEPGTADDIAFFTHSNLCFDLSKVIAVPDDCVCSIFPESTRDVFALGYDISVRLDVTGLIQNKIDKESTLNERVATYVANDKHIVVENKTDQLSLPKEKYHHRLKTYTLHLNPLSIIIGNIGYQTNNNSNNGF